MDLYKKLKIDPEKPVWLFNMPASAEVLFKNLKLKKALEEKGIDQGLFFAINSAILNEKIDDLFASLKDNAVFWVAYPKKSGSIQSDLTRDSGWENVYKSEWIPVSAVSINQDWSAIRIKKRDKDAAYIRDTPSAERKTAGIDYVQRIVKLPSDAENELDKYNSLKAFFYSLSFTHKKEYAEAIAEAKKPETRTRRIEKMVEMVLKLKSEKENKAKK